MSNLSINNFELYQDINFTEKHIGGIEKDTANTFNNQANILANTNNDYQRLLDYNNKIEREKNKNDNYVERLDNEKHTTVYRINNYPTYIDDINYSNPVIYPKNYDMYFDYLQKKNINHINTQVVKKKTYINIDSSNRNLETFINTSEYIEIENNSLEFKNQTNSLKIYVPKAKTYFKENDYIILRGFKNYNIFYQKLNFFFTNNSALVILDLKPNFTEIIPYYDIFIKISGVTTSDNKNSWKNIPLNVINQEHKISLNEINGEIRMSITLPIVFYTENESDKILQSDCIITYYAVGNYPINLVNSNTPISYGYLSPYLIINQVSENYIIVYLLNIISINKNIILDGIWVDDNTFRTGSNIQIGLINGFIQGYPNPNNYVMNLDNTYNNVCSIKMVSSEIPNVIQNISNNTGSIYIESENNLKYITNVNNKFYWDNILDEGIYSIELEPGYYLYPDLKRIIENKISQVPRKFIFPNTYLYKYNEINIDFNTDTNITNVNFFNIYTYPNCLESLTEMDIDNNGNNFLIRINHINHNLKVGDTIYIVDSLDYYNIKSDYINTPLGHKIINVINNNYYEIKISNINKIDNVGDTNGGNSIKIKYYAIFRLFFNFSDTFGSLIGFSLSGLPNSYTNYSSAYTNYTINNTQPYYNDVKKILIVNNSATSLDLDVSYNKLNYRYILLLAENLNNNYSPNGPAYFYKFLLNGQPNSYLYNTFVTSPVYFNPPIKTLTNFKFTFIYPDGSLVNFGNLNNSFTLEITTIDNLPENTNISTYIARM